MRSVLYTDDMEPITVLEVGQWALDVLHKTGYVFFVAPEPLRLTRPEDADTICTPLRKVMIYGEWFVRKGERHLMLFTKDEESALLLKAAVLPGQQRLFNEQYTKGIMRALVEMLRRDE